MLALYEVCLPYACPMAFEFPTDLHAELAPLAWLLGTWRGRGHGEYPGIERFQFAQEVVFGHDTRPFLTYYSRSWIVDEDGEILRPAAVETGFWRAKPNNTLEVLLAHSSGISEGWLGHFDGPKIQLALDHGYSAPTAKTVSDGHRLYGLVEGELFFAYDMATPEHELQPHLWATLPRA
jgi:hypothetical protein